MNRDIRESKIKSNQSVSHPYIQYNHINSITHAWIFGPFERCVCGIKLGLGVWRVWRVYVCVKLGSPCCLNVIKYVLRQFWKGKMQKQIYCVCQFWLNFVCVCCQNCEKLKIIVSCVLCLFFQSICVCVPFEMTNACLFVCFSFSRVLQLHIFFWCWSNVCSIRACASECFVSSHFSFARNVIRTTEQ